MTYAIIYDLVLTSVYSREHDTLFLVMLPVGKLLKRACTFSFVCQIMLESAS